MIQQPRFHSGDTVYAKQQIIQNTQRSYEKRPIKERLHDYAHVIAEVSLHEIEYDVWKIVYAFRYWPDGKIFTANEVELCDESEAVVIMNLTDANNLTKEER